MGAVEFNSFALTMWAVAVASSICIACLIDFACRRFFYHKEEFTRRIMRHGGGER